jgi:major membrane immunogen (membrane-anchored lipoprotein)
MKKTLLVVTIALSVGLIGCQKSSDKPVDTKTPAATSTTATPSVSAKDTLNKFFAANADFKQLTLSLKPTDADYAAYFDASVVDQAKTGYKDLWENTPSFQPQEGQTELVLYQATTEEIKNLTGEGADFPGGYADVIDKIKPNQTIYRFKFVIPGETVGMSFDGLVYVNGHWVLFPKPWKAIN